MNNIIKTTLLAAIAASMASCTDLDVDVKSKYTEYPDSKVAIEAKMSDVYYAFRSALGNNYNRVQTFSSDEATGVSYDGDYWDNGENVHPTLHAFLAEDAPATYWTDLASGITKCNKVIDDLGDKPASIAPARVMRAFYHFILMDSYGDVPILDHLPDDNEAVNRDKRKDVAEFIEKELKECLPYLSADNNASTYGKPNKVNAPGMYYGRYRTFRKIDNGDTTGYYSGKMSKSCAGICAMNTCFADLFSLPGDDRNDAVLGGMVNIHDAITGEDTGKPYMYKGAQLELTKTITLKDGGLSQLNCGATADGWRQGWRSIKFYPNPNEYSAYNRSQSNDVPIFRYADIILTKAEAIMRGAAATNGDTPQSLFNQIRSYVHAPQLDHTPSLQELLDERGREFFDENWRRNDMIRFGTFESEYGFHVHSNPDARFEKTCRILPVPQSVMKENTNWTQNAGY